MMALITLLCSSELAGQVPKPATLTLSQAVAIAMEKNPTWKAALADKQASSAGVREARSFLLPHLTFSETATRGNDPVYVFGSKLRQQRFTSNDFALNQLNTPTPFGNFSTRFAGTWNLFDSFASWHGVSRAKHMDDAAEHQLARSEQEVVFGVVNAYYGLLLAGKGVEIAEQAAKTAQAIMERSQARYESGLVVESDLLSAKVRRASREQDLIRARNNVALAQCQLSVAMGMPAESSFSPADVLAELNLPVPALEEIEKEALANRPDLQRIQLQEAAQQQSVSIAKSAFGPRLNAFAGWEMDNPTFLAGGGGNNWLGGLELQFDLFEGGAKRAQLFRERALQEKVAALRQSANDAVRLEIRRAYYDLDASRHQVEISRAAISEANESLRITQERYNGGLTTITELLSAEEAAQRSQTNYWETVYRVQTSYASLELAKGSLNTKSPVVTP